VRKEMWRLSDETSPGHIPASESTGELHSRQTTVCPNWQLTSNSRSVCVQLHLWDFESLPGD
jgi:hypothetical protein